MGKSRLDLSALDLKLLAMAAMLVDHMGYLLFPTAMSCRSGCAFPCPWRRCRPQGRAICWANGCRRTISAPGC